LSPWYNYRNVRINRLCKEKRAEISPIKWKHYLAFGDRTGGGGRFYVLDFSGFYRFFLNRGCMLRALFGGGQYCVELRASHLLGRCSTT
jgi:hypothetical protein